MSNACKLLKHCQNNVQLHVQFCSSKYVMAAQSNCINFFQCVDITCTHKSSDIKTTGPHEGNLAIIYIKLLIIAQPFYYLFSVKYLSFIFFPKCNPSPNSEGFFLFLIGIHSMQGWTATMRHRVTRKEVQKRLQNTENLFRKNLQVKDVC